ncbi:hypothetical protein [Staphylococcus equorum]|nr:hypothetical protein [Staphylococcus equorum]MCE5006667.1 hypothetical protein [Staphylococcus equorum]
MSAFSIQSATAKLKSEVETKYMSQLHFFCTLSVGAVSAFSICLVLY